MTDIVGRSIMGKDNLKVVVLPDGVVHIALFTSYDDTHLIDVFATEEGAQQAIDDYTEGIRHTIETSMPGKNYGHIASIPLKDAEEVEYLAEAMKRINHKQRQMELWSYFAGGLQDDVNQTIEIIHDFLAGDASAEDLKDFADKLDDSRTGWQATDTWHSEPDL